MIAVEVGDRDVDDRTHPVLRQPALTTPAETPASMAAAMVAGSDWSTKRDGARHQVGRAAYVLDGVAARTVDADDDNVGASARTRPIEVLRAFSSRARQTIAGRRQPASTISAQVGLSSIKQDRTGGHDGWHSRVHAAGRNFMP